LERRDSLGLAMVGARRCTAYGREQAERLAGLCAQSGLTIISGGARGIDSAAHRAAMRVHGRTLAVLGSGLANPYPKENAELFDQIAAEHGAVISELPMNAAPIAENFPRRNRIISGLSLGVLVVEAANRSGALITARLASEEHHREVLALPGRVDSTASAGCHRIIREGWATLVTNAADILDALGEAGQTLKAAMLETENEHSSDDPTPATNLPAEQKTLFDALDSEPVTMDQLCSRSGLSIAQVQAQLTPLQLAGHIERLPGNRVRRRR